MNTRFLKCELCGASFVGSEHATIMGKVACGDCWDHFDDSDDDEPDPHADEIPDGMGEP